MSARPLVLASAAGVLAFTVSAAAAAAPAEDPRVRQLEATVASQAAVIEALELRMRSLEARLASSAPTAFPQAPAAPAALPPSALPASASAPPDATATTIKVRGRVHADAWTVDGGPDGTEIRRARLGVEGRIDGRFPYVVEVDFAGNAVSLQDVYVDYPLGARAAVRLGYHKVPFGLDDQTSDNYNLFLEHPVGIDPFTPGRGVAAAVMAHGARWYAHAGVFGEGENDARDGRVAEGLTVAARLVWAPVLAPRRYLHLGLAGYHADLGETPGLQLRERPARHLADYAATTGALDARHMDALGLEAAFGAGPFGATAEYTAVQVEERARGRLEFSGWSLEGWWALTGETRPYKLNGGVFDRLAPRRPVVAGGPGAWLLAARYSALDLQDGTLPAGELSSASLGLNWHLTNHTRVMVDVSRVVIDTAAGRARQTGAGARVQYDW